MLDNAKKRISIANDHAGFELKRILAEHLRSRGFTVFDHGADSIASVDYPDFAVLVVNSILHGESDYGILICGTGNGMAISANRYVGIRAAHCTNLYLAKMARQHNNANIITLGSRIAHIEDAIAMVDVFLSTTFIGGRHARRVDKLDRGH